MTEDNRMRYKIICPCCGSVQYACKSIFQEMGLRNAGRGGCLECKEPMKLIYNPEADTMQADKWELGQNEEM